MGLGMMLLLARAHAACPPLGDALESTTTALVDGRDTAPGFAAAEVSLACAPARPGELARLWLLHGAALQLAGDFAAAEPYFAAATALDPTQWDDRLGPTIRASLAAARPAQPGQLQANRPLTIDGEKVTKFPAPVASGPHALRAAEVQWAKVVVVAPAETLKVEVPATAPKTKGAPRRSAAWAVAGGVALAGAVGCGVGAVLQTDTMADAGTVSALDEAWATQQALGGGAIGLAVLGATGIVLQVAL